MVPLGDKHQVEAHFGPFGNGANLDARLVHGLRQTCHRLGNHFGHPMELLGDMGHVESHFFLFGDIVTVGATYVHSLRQTYHRLRNHFGRTQWYH